MKKSLFVENLTRVQPQQRIRKLIFIYICMVLEIWQRERKGDDATFDSRFIFHRGKHAGIQQLAHSKHES